MMHPDTDENDPSDNVGNQPYPLKISLYLLMNQRYKLDVLNWKAKKLSLRTKNSIPQPAIYI